MNALFPPVAAKRKPRASAKPKPTEAAVQIAIRQRLVFFGCLVISIPNEGKRSVVHGRRMKSLGLATGAPDLLIYRHGKHALLEVKRPGYSPSDVRDSQRDMHARLGSHGFPVAIVTSPDEAIAALEDAGWRFA